MTKKPFIQRNSVIPAIICTALWGSAIPFVKIGYDMFGVTTDISKIAFSGCRFTLSGILVLMFFKLQGNDIKPKKNEIRAILILSLVQTVVQYVFYSIGVANTSGLRGSVLGASSTFFSVIAAHFAFKSDRLTFKKMAGCVIGFIGVLVVISGGASAGGQPIRLTGEGFMLISAFGQGVGAVVSRKEANGINPLLLTGWQLFIGGTVLALFYIPARSAGDTMSITSQGDINTVICILLMLYLALLSAVAFSIWTMLFKYHEIAKITVYMFLVPIFGSILSAFLLGEDIFSIKNLFALVFVCVGIFVVNKKST